MEKSRVIEINDDDDDAVGTIAPVEKCAQLILSETQRATLELCLDGHNVFITGEAGSGKSTLLEELKREFEARDTHYQVTASTGSAAWNVGGTTLHGWAGIGLGDKKDVAQYAKEIRQRRPDKLKDWQWTECLIIDEVSMIDVEYFEKLEKLGRLLKNITRPFGGMQLILVGDYFQCPPIDRNARKDDKKPAKPKYLFQSPLWKSLGIRCQVLRQNFRQASDPEFRELLQRIKTDSALPEDTETLRKRLMTQHADANQSLMTKLMSRRAAVEQVNRTELDRLPGKSHSYKGVEVKCNAIGVPCLTAVGAPDGASPVRYPVDLNIELKVGAQVLLCCNMDVSEGLFNGSRGVVVDFKPNGKADKAIHYPVVEFERGQRVLVTPNRWESVQKRRLVSIFEQVPLILRYAMTVHKAQGLTLDRALVSMDFFDTGLAYVALSRVRELQHLYLKNVDMKTVLADPLVVEFARANGIL